MKRTKGQVWIGATLAAGASIVAGGCLRSADRMATLEEREQHDRTQPADAIASESLPPVMRVGGNTQTVIERRGDSFYAGPCSITTPLPEGYPDPTPPGAIDIKRYPSVRRAEVNGEGMPDIGMNIGFFPLFNHIKDRGIAMTSPVEMDYRGGEEGEAGTDWTMSFLYRTSDLGPTGADGKVAVVDTEPMTVIAFGGRGGYSRSRVQDGVETLRRWLDENPHWRAAGDPRALYYNGPDVRNRDKWFEVQIPIRSVEPR